MAENFNPIGSAMISVADMVFFDTVNGKEIGKAIALTDSGLESTMSNNEIRGGYLNELLFNILHSRTFNVTATSATFKMLYLAFQTGGAIVDGLSDAYVLKECQTAVAGNITLDKQPVGFVHVVYSDGTENDIASTAGSKTINVGAGKNGTIICSYFTAENGETVTINTQTQPMTVKAIMTIHAKEQNGTKKTIQITIPLLQFSGEINFAMTADGVSTQNINGMALAYGTDCGENKYADLTVFTEGSSGVTPQAIVGVPNAYTMKAADVVTANIIGVMPAMYANKVIPFGNELVFTSGTAATATVASATGKITAVATGTSDISVVYTPAGGTPLTTTIKVTVQA